MKSRSSLLLIVWLLMHNFPGAAATCEDYITQGRAFLSATNLIGANNNFSNAVLCSPSNLTGNLFYATTRLLVLPNRPVGSNFLNRLGVTNAGRNIYDWTAQPPTETNGIPRAPAGVNANEATALLRTNILAEVLAAQTNLARVADTNFTLNLTSTETRSTAVTLDYGDVRLLCAALKFSEFWIYTTYSWNLDAQLSMLRSFYSNDEFSVEGLLRTYPSLFNYATTNDLNAAKAAFTNAVACYLDASQFIRSRPTNTVRLFNISGSSALEREENFRLTLIDFRNSLSAPVTLAVNPRLTVDFRTQFTGTHPLRSIFPEFHGRGFVLGTWPDLTFGGLISGVDRGSFEEGMTHLTTSVPKIAGAARMSGQQLLLRLNTLRERGYVVQTSPDLVQWSIADAFFASGPTTDVLDTITPGSRARFYRVIDRTENMPPPANDNFANRIHIGGLPVVVSGYTANASRETCEPGFSWNTIWWSWTPPISGMVQIDAVGDSYANIEVFTGKSLCDLNHAAYGYEPFYVVAGASYQIQVGAYYDDGGVQIAISVPPSLTVTSPDDGSVYPMPTNITISAFASDDDGSISRLRVETDWAGRIAQTTNSSISIVASNVSVGQHYITVSAVDNVGVTTWASLSITIRPPNDLFANRIAISGVPAAVTGANEGASEEPNEPAHGINSSGASVWWTWTAPFTGTATINAQLTTRTGYPVNSLLGVYRGTLVSSLTPIASGASGNFPSAQVSFTASLGVAYQIAVDGQYGSAGSIALQILRTAPPSITITNPLAGDSFYVPTPADIPIGAEVFDSDGSIARVDYYDASYTYPQMLIGTATTSPYTIAWQNLTEGSYYVFAKATDNSGAFTYSPTVYFDVISRAANDFFDERITLTGTSVTASGSNVSATSEFDEPSTAGNSPEASVWWRWTAPKNGTATISTAGSDFDTVLGVYTGTDLFSLDWVAADDDSGGNLTSRVVFNATAGVTYQIVVDGYNGAMGSITLSLSEP